MSTEEIGYPDHIRMRDVRQDLALFKKSREPGPEQSKIFGGNGRRDSARLTQRQRTRQIFLDSDGITVLVMRQIDNTEPARSNLLYNAISSDFQPIRQRGIVL